MSVIISPDILLIQSKQEYAKFLKSKDLDVFAEAGELLWESLKAYLMQATKQKLDGVRAMENIAGQMGEVYNELFFHCQHFHSWYLGVGVPNDFAAEKKLYTQSLQILEKIINQ
ncbi:MAG: hypothetical protein ACQCN5_10690 [Candidatus Bathyarchaeia archaeon]|jgi:hypothetical protein